MTPEQKREMRKHAVAVDDYHNEVREDLLECLEEIDRLQEDQQNYMGSLTEARDEAERLREALRDAICFMKDSKRVSIKSRAIQLEAEFLGGE